MKRLDAVLLAGVGVLVSHQLAYSLSAALGYENSIAHGHLATAWLLGGLAALMVLASSVTRSLRNREHASASLVRLSGWIVAGYTAMEAAERTWDGAGATSLLTESVFWLGLGAAPLVALLLRWSVGKVTRLASTLVSSLGEEPTFTPLAHHFGVTRVLIPVRVDSTFNHPRRGPPA